MMINLVYLNSATLSLPFLVHLIYRFATVKIQSCMQFHQFVFLLFPNQIVGS